MTALSSVHDITLS